MLNPVFQLFNCKLLTFVDVLLHVKVLLDPFLFIQEYIVIISLLEFKTCHFHVTHSLIEAFDLDFVSFNFGRLDNHVFCFLGEIEVQLINDFLLFLCFFFEAIIWNCKKLFLFFYLLGKVIDLFNLITEHLIVIFLHIVELLLMYDNKGFHLSILAVNLIQKLRIMIFNFINCLYHGMQVLALLLITAPELIHLLLILRCQVLKLHYLCLVFLYRPPGSQTLLACLVGPSPGTKGAAPGHVVAGPLGEPIGGVQLLLLVVEGRETWEGSVLVKLVRVVG